tara:strand:+ start:289 stop:657 length:369 start_codon:yes stop_codon:yes gene_type:complete
MDKDIDIIKTIHAKYLHFMNNRDINKVSELFEYPAVFKGFLDKVQIAKDAKELKDIYKDLITSAPIADSIMLNDTVPFKLRDDTYAIIMSYSQYNNKKEIFSGSACYIFSKINKKWKMNAVL